jgi:type IV fimbrial biogenesis protein FimT
MLTRRPGALEGFTLIEVMIAMAVMAIALALGLPNVSVWIQNTQLKTAAEAMVSGLQLARAEALRRNTSVCFQLAGPDWVVSVPDDPTVPGGCGVAASQIVQKRAGSEGSLNATVNANAASAVFTGLGRLNTLFVNIAQINIRNPTGGACQPPDGTGQMRCLSVLVGNGGQVRMCDPAVPAAVPPAADDPRSCGARPPYAFVP